MTTNNVVNVNLSGQTGTGNFVGSTTPSISQPNLIGVTTNSNAAAGSVGEFITSNVQSGSAVSLSNVTAKDVTTIALTAGDWDVYGNVTIIISGVATGAFAWASTASATLPDGSNYVGVQSSSTIGSTGMTVPTQRISVAGNQTMYLSALCAFSTSTATACGTIFARRVR